MKNVLVEICVYVAESSHNADTDMQLFKFWHILEKTNMFFSLGRICLHPTLHACVTLVLIHVFVPTIVRTLCVNIRNTEKSKLL